MKNLIRTRVISIGIVAMIWFFSVTSGFGGIRSPGKYSGIVVFDRWDTCYLYGGTYLMYISEKKKELLRPYAGRSVLIDATEVLQPINPGDGLITAFKFLGDAPIGEGLPSVDGLKLNLTKERFAGNSVRFVVEIENKNRSRVTVSKSEIAPTVFGRKTDDDPFSPSDGISEAKITRCNFGSRCGFPGLSYGPDGQLTSDSFSVDVDRSFQPDPETIDLGGSQKFTLSFYVVISKGDYDLIVGYGGGVHGGKFLASNIISFSADARGHATTVAEILGKVSTVGHEKPNLMNLLFGNYIDGSQAVFFKNL